MKNKFYTTAASTETPAIKAELEKLGYSELQPSGQNNHLFVDTVNETFWDCDNEAMETNKRMAESQGEVPQQLTLIEVKSWTPQH